MGVAGDAGCCVIQGNRGVECRQRFRIDTAPHRLDKIGRLLGGGITGHGAIAHVDKMQGKQATAFGESRSRSLRGVAILQLHVIQADDWRARIDATAVRARCSAIAVLDRYVAQQQVSAGARVIDHAAGIVAGDRRRRGRTSGDAEPGQRRSNFSIRQRDQAAL
jgi:hypothetical protein